MATRAQILSRLAIHPDHWVLEIGSGPDPFPRSDVLADADLAENAERSGPLRIDRPLVVCDAHRLPFRDGAFDYIFCSQTLEHLTDPKAFFAELERVGYAGYLETPNELRERLYGWPFHRWIVDVRGGQLVLRPRDVPQTFGLTFHRLQQENFEFAHFVASHHDLLNICFEWRGHIPYRFAGPDEYPEPGPAEIQNPLAVAYGGRRRPDFRLSLRAAWSLFNVTPPVERLKRRIPRALIQRLKGETPLPAPRRSRSEVEEHLGRVLACPVCRRPLGYRPAAPALDCPGCARCYENRGGVPILLPSGGPASTGGPRAL